MAKKLTDAAVAKALGWRIVDCGPLHGFTWRKEGCPDGLPPFTTSLDAIVAEVEARGLKSEYRAYNDEPGYSAQVWEGGASIKFGICVKAKTPPLALCAALLAYLKEKP